MALSADISSCTSAKGKVDIQGIGSLNPPPIYTNLGPTENSMMHNHWRKYTVTSVSPIPLFTICKEGRL